MAKIDDLIASVNGLVTEMKRQNRKSGDGSPTSQPDRSLPNDPQERKDLLDFLKDEATARGAILEVRHHEKEILREQLDQYSKEVDALSLKATNLDKKSDE